MTSSWQQMFPKCKAAICSAVWGKRKLPSEAMQLDPLGTELLMATVLSAWSCSLRLTSNGQCWSLRIEFLWSRHKRHQGSEMGLGGPSQGEKNVVRKQGSHLSAISQDWPTVCLKQQNICFLCVAPLNLRCLPPTHTASRGFMTCELKEAFLLPRNKLLKGSSAWIYRDSPRCWNMGSTKDPWSIAGRHRDYSSQSALHTLEKSK